MNRVLQGFAVGATTLALATSVCVPTGIYTFSCGASKAYAVESAQVEGMLDGEYTVSGLAADSDVLKLESGLSLSNPRVTISGGEVKLTFTTGTYAIDRMTVATPDDITSATTGVAGTPRYASKQIAAEKAEQKANDPTAELPFAEGEVSGATFTLTLTKAQLAEALEGSASNGTGLQLVVHYSSAYENAELAGTWAKSKPVHLSIGSVERVVKAGEEPSDTSDIGGNSGSEGDNVGTGDGAGTGDTGSGNQGGSATTGGNGSGTNEGGGEGTGTETPSDPAVTLEEVKALIEALPGVLDVKASDKDAIEQAQKAYASLSAEDQQVLKTSSPDPEVRLTTQPYTRLLESAAWGLAALGEVDSSTTLIDGTYSSVTSPALTQSSSKGQSTSSRVRTWSITEIAVVDAKATATLTVNSSTYDYICVGGQRFENTAAKGANSTFAGVPINLNTPLYFGAHSTLMNTGIAYQVTTSIAEPTPVERVKLLIKALPTDPFDYTEELADAVKLATDEFEALTEEEQAAIAAEVPGDGNEQAYGRLLESAQWSIAALEEVDNATDLADGTYSGEEKITSESDMGLSTSARQRKWTCESITVKDGKAIARISWDGNKPLDELHIGGEVYKNLSTTGGSIFEIPANLNDDIYFSVKITDATEATDAVAYHLFITIDEATTSPDAVVVPDDPPADDPTPSDPGDNNGGSNSNAGTPTNNSSTPPSGTVTPSSSTVSRGTVNKGSVVRSTAVTRSTSAAAAKATVPGSTNPNSGVGQAQATLNRDLRAATSGNIETADLYQASNVVQRDRTPFAVLFSLLAAAVTGAIAFLTRFYRAER